MDTEYISFDISGRPDSNSGFTTIVLYNSPPFELQDEVHSGFGLNNHFFCVKIANNYTLYKLVLNKVQSYGAIRESNLIIGLSIPRGYRLSSSNPFQILKDILNKFINLCMIEGSDGIHKFKKDVLYYSNLQDKMSQIGMKYQIEPFVDNQFVLMNPNGQRAYFVANDSVIENLMIDVQYEQFSPFGEIIFANIVTSTNAVEIKNLIIPNPRKTNKEQPQISSFSQPHKNGISNDMLAQIDSASNSGCNVQNKQVSGTADCEINDESQKRQSGIVSLSNLNIGHLIKYIIGFVVGIIFCLLIMIIIKTVDNPALTSKLDSDISENSFSKTDNEEYLVRDMPKGVEVINVVETDTLFVITQRLKFNSSVNNLNFDLNFNTY